MSGIKNISMKSSINTVARLAWDRLFYSKNTRQIIWILSWKVCNFPLDSCLKAVDVKSMIMDYIPVEVLSQPGIAGILTLQHESFISPLGDFIGSLFFALKVWHFQRGVVVNREPVWEMYTPPYWQIPTLLPRYSIKLPTFNVATEIC